VSGGHRGHFGREEFDVVVVGAGSAGCALAGRLTEDPTLRVLLLEAGGSDDVLEVRVPAGLYKTWAHPAGLELHDRAAARAGRPEAVLAAGEAAGRFVVDERDDLHPGRAGRLRRVGRPDR
jgi:choline dehydrogenase-like flavoprotein